jgi:hypothetical protein
LSLLKEKFSDVEASKLDLLFGLMLLASKKKDEIMTNCISAYYKANVQHTLKFVSDTVRRMVDNVNVNRPSLENVNIT